MREVWRAERRACISDGIVVAFAFGGLWEMFGLKTQGQRRKERSCSDEACMSK